MRRLTPAHELHQKTTTGSFRKARASTVNFLPLPATALIRFGGDCILYLVPNPRHSPAMDTFETDVEIHADGSVRLLSPRPAWLKPGRARVLMTVEPLTGPEKPKRLKLTATPEMIERRMAALEEIRKLNPYRDIIDPVEWRREIREDRPLPGRH